MGVCLSFGSSERKELAFLWQLGEVVKKLLGIFCFSQFCLDVPVRGVANDTGMVGFPRNCKVDERFDGALICKLLL